MKQSASQKKSQCNPSSSAGPQGSTIEPPVYGIESLDSAQVGAIQMKTGSLTLPNRTGLPDALKSGVESLSGLSLDDVRVHYNSSRPAQLQALAYTQGTQIHVAPGQERHLPHEAWHVVQQKQGRVKPTMQMQGAGINDDAHLENEATMMGHKATDVARLTAFGVGMPIQGVVAQLRGAPFPVVQRLVTSGAANGAVATITNPVLTTWIAQNTSPRVRAIARHNDINLNVVWDGGLGNPANTNMEITWVENGVPQGPWDLFDNTNAPAVGAMDFDHLGGYDINIEMQIQTPQVAPSTWRGTLLHELEAHTGLASTVSKLVDGAIADRNKRPSFLNKIAATMNARSVVEEHRSWAFGGGGSEDSMTRVVNNTPRPQKVATIVDIAGDRIQEAQDNWPVAVPDTHRQVYNTVMGKIRSWLRAMKASIRNPALTLAETNSIDAEIANAANR